MTQIARATLKQNEGSDSLGRYYTKTDIGGLLIDQMAGLSPNRVLDLGAGAGMLSTAALRRWKNVELLTVDVDVAARTHLRNLFKSTHGVKHYHIHADALSDRLPKLISARTDSIDAAVCNPPFIIPKWRKGFAQIIEDVGFSGCLPVLSEIDAALLFLAQNLRLMSSNATLGIIVPDSLVSAAKYRLFRRELLQRYAVRKAIRLPRHSFQGTDAQAYILVIGKESVETQQIPLQKFEGDSAMSSELLVDVDAATDRLDFDYHANKSQIRTFKKNQISLGSIALDIRRGALTSSDIGAFDFPIFHTTDMPVDLAGEWCDLRQFGKSMGHATAANRHVVCAEPGDILLARVGRNLEHKVFGVASGYPILTDCIYRIRVPEETRKKILRQLVSCEGQAWLASRCYGVSAKQLSKADLVTFPVSI